MAGAVEDGDRSVGAAFELGDEVVATLQKLGDLAFAERADFQFGHGVVLDRSFPCGARSALTGSLDYVELQSLLCRSGR